MLVSALALLAAPLIIASLWGAPLGDDAYVGFAHARNLAAGRALTIGLTTAETTSPLYLVLWMLLVKLGIPLLPASVVLSGLGWSATALALYGIGRAIGAHTSPAPERSDDHRKISLIPGHGCLRMDSGFDNHENRSPICGSSRA